MNKQLNKALFFFKMLMSLVYIAIGLTLIFKSAEVKDVIPAPYAPIVGILAIAYGLFRGYRAYTLEQKAGE